jgi:ATP-binding cassette subfamily F protein uup
LPSRRGLLKRRACPRPLLTLQDVHLTFGGTPVLEGAELSIGERERVCLVGRNGSGKSTLLKIAAGLVEADRGTRFAQPGATVRYLAQEPDLAGFATTLGLCGGRPRARRRSAPCALSARTARADRRRGSRAALGGEARRAALARVLAPEPDILLLDEPTNHLDLPAIEWLENELAGSRSALVLISHDRRFLEKLSRATRGSTAASRGASSAALRPSRNGATRCWRKRSASSTSSAARSSPRSTGCATASPRGASATCAGSGCWPSCVRIFASIRGALGSVKIAVTEADLSGKLVAEAERVSKSFGEAPIVRDFSIRIQRGDRIGLVGPNGAGKTTLLKMLTGSSAPTTARSRSA